MKKIILISHPNDLLLFYLRFFDFVIRRCFFNFKNFVEIRHWSIWFSSKKQKKKSEEFLLLLLLGQRFIFSSSIFLHLIDVIDIARLVDINRRTKENDRYRIKMRHPKQKSGLSFLPISSSSFLSFSRWTSFKSISTYFNLSNDQWLEIWTIKLNKSENITRRNRIEKKRTNSFEVESEKSSIDNWWGIAF